MPASSRTSTHHDRAPEDIVDAIFKGVISAGPGQSESGLPAGSTHLLSATVQRSNKVRRSGGGAASSSLTPGSSKGARPGMHPRTVSASSLSTKKSDRALLFGIGKCKEKGREKGPSKKASPASSISNLSAHSTAASPVASLKSLASRTSGATDMESIASSHTKAGSAPGPADTIPPLTRNAASEVDVAVLGKTTKRRSAVRWEFDEAHTLSKKPSDNFLKPPSFLVGGSHATGSVGGTLASASSSTSDLGLRTISSNSTVDGEAFARAQAEDDHPTPKRPPAEQIPLTPHQVDAPVTGLGLHLSHSSKAPISVRHSDGDLKAKAKRSLGRDSPHDPDTTVTFTSPSKPGLTVPLPAEASPVRSRKTSASDLRSTYRAQLPFASGLGSGAVVGLERIKQKSRELETSAKEAIRAIQEREPRIRSKLLSRALSPSIGSRPSSAPVTVSDSSHRRVSKGMVGVQPTVAASRGWKGAGWQLSLDETALSVETEKPRGPDSVSPIASSGENEFTQSVVPVTTPRATHQRQVSDVSVYYDVDEDDDPDQSTATVIDHSEPLAASVH